MALDGVTFFGRTGADLWLPRSHRAGKTTAMRAVMGILDPDRGSVRSG